MRAVPRVPLALALALCVLLAACSSRRDDAASTSGRPSASSGTSAATTTTTAPTNPAQVTALRLDPTKSYGNDYADGILPVGDGLFVTDGPKAGYVYRCRAPVGGGGAQSRGPWLVHNHTQYDLNKKVAVQGDVRWVGTYSMTIDGSQRVITTNDLPHDHTAGVFPVQPSDPASQYDRNPNRIAAQSLTYRLAATPTVN